MPKTVDTRSHCKVWLRACNNLPQPPPYILVFWGCGRLLHVLNHTLQWLLVSTVFGTVSSLHLIYDFYTCIQRGCHPIVIYIKYADVKYIFQREIEIHAIHMTMCTFIVYTVLLLLFCTTHIRAVIFSNTIPFCHHHSCPIERVVSLVSNETTDSAHLSVVSRGELCISHCAS